VKAEDRKNGHDEKEREVSEEGHGASESSGRSNKAAKIRGGSQSSGAGAGKVNFNPFSITRKID
jgi:hypothetical protein